MHEPLRLVVFIDAQNTYRGARESFFHNEGPSVAGQFDPVRLAKLIESRGGSGSAMCTLESVRVYTGRPDPERQPRTYAAHLKQCARWERESVVVIHRQLRYPASWPNEKPQEKGIDISLAIDFVTMAIDGEYDLGVIVSTDTDLRPPLEFVRSRYPGSRHVAVAAWRSSRGSRRLSIPEFNVWCHWLTKEDYDAVADLTNYNE